MSVGVDPAYSRAAGTVSLGNAGSGRRADLWLPLRPRLARTHTATRVHGDRDSRAPRPRLAGVRQRDLRLGRLRRAAT
jgi:hypothetical protein